MLNQQIMTKAQILSDKGFNYISSLSLEDRYYALFISHNTELIAKVWNVTIKEYSFSMLSSIGEEDIILSVLNGDTASIAVIHPLDN